jgi:DNA-binding transcriptional ArsR family regulator
MTTQDTLSATFGALADPTRRAILARLLEGEASIAELAKPFSLTPRAVSKHVAVLEAAGLVTKGRDAQRRPSRIIANRLIEIDCWLTNYRKLWLQRFDKLETHLARQTGKNDG